MDSTLWEGRTGKGFLYPSFWPALLRTPARGKFSHPHLSQYIPSQLSLTLLGVFCHSLSPLSSQTPNIILRRFTRPPVFNRNSLFFCFLSKLSPPSPLLEVWWCWSICLIKLFISAGYGGEIRSSQSMIQTSALPHTRRQLG